MANIPKYSPKGRAALEKQVADYQALVEKLMLENPAFHPKAPITLSGKSETTLDETVTRNPGANDPGGSTTKNSRTTTDAPTLIAPTTGEDAVRSRHDKLRDFIDTAQLDLADEGRLATRIPMTTEEAMDIASGQVAAMPEAKKIRSFSSLLGVKGTGGATDRAQDMLLRGAVPDDGFTFIRSLLSGAKEDPRLLAELMGQINNAGGAPRVPFAQVSTDFAPDVAEAFTAEGTRSWMGTGAPGSAADVAHYASQREGAVRNTANAIPGYERGLESLGADAINKISRNRKMATIGGALAGITAVGAGTAYAMHDSDADKYNQNARKIMFGAGGPDTIKLSEKDPAKYGEALNAALNTYVGREFGDSKSALYGRYSSLVGKHRQTISRLGEGTMRPDASTSDAGYKELVKDLNDFYASGGYNEKNPVMLPYGDSNKSGVLSIDKTGTKLARLKQHDFQSIKD